MVKIRRAYEALFLGLFLFFLFITDLRYLKGWPVSLFLEADSARRRGDGGDDAHHLPQSGVGPGDHRHHDDGRRKSGATGCAHLEFCTISSAGSAIAGIRSK